MDGRRAEGPVPETAPSLVVFKQELQFLLAKDGCAYTLIAVACGIVLPFGFSSFFF